VRRRVLGSKRETNHQNTMSAPPPPRFATEPTSSSGSGNPQRPEPTAIQTSAAAPSTSNSTLRPDATLSQAAPRKKRNHRGGRKKRTRKQSFAVSTEDGSVMPETPQPHRGAQSQGAVRSSFYRLQGRNLSNTSLESEALLDHR